jgi:hypothetical protein
VDSIYDDIPEDIESYFLPKTPTFPAGGLDLKCPGCNRNRKYHRSGLRYGGERRQGATPLGRWAKMLGKLERVEVKIFSDFGGNA